MLGFDKTCCGVRPAARKKCEHFARDHGQFMKIIGSWVGVPQFGNDLFKRGHGIFLQQRGKPTTTITPSRSFMKASFDDCLIITILFCPPFGFSFILFSLFHSHPTENA